MKRRRYILAWTVAKRDERAKGAPLTTYPVHEFECFARCDSIEEAEKLLEEYAKRFERTGNMWIKEWAIAEVVKEGGEVIR